MPASEENTEEHARLSKIAFPKLSSAQIERIGRIAKQRDFGDDDVLWEVGDRSASFYVVITGQVDICYPQADGTMQLVTTHEPGSFTGDVDLLSSKSAAVSGIASGATSTLEVCPRTLKKLVVADVEISNLLLAAFLARRQLLVSQNYGDITLLGSRYSPELYTLREFLERNSRPFNWVDVESDPAAEQLVNSFQLSCSDMPAVITGKGKVCRNPSVADMAAALGLSDIGEDEVYDMVVVGGGPAGLAAAVYGGSEGLNTLVLDARAPGGQAGTSSRIENYLGFPLGISGAELAQNALLQAEKFGVRFATPRRVEQLQRAGNIYRLLLENGDALLARSVVAACGVYYRRLRAANAEKFEGKGIYFAATQMEADLCAQQEVAIVGGGNSAGQAAVFLARQAKKVHILIRSGDLDHSMSRYLIDRIELLPNVQLHTHTEIQNFMGDNRLESIEVRNNKTDTLTRLPVNHVFVFIGAVANTQWLEGNVLLDEHGFVHTGESLPRSQLNNSDWTDVRQPSTFETSLPGIFAVGDVRCGSTKRVASAVGEGSVTVQFVHRHIAGIEAETVMAGAVNL